MHTQAPRPGQGTPPPPVPCKGDLVTLSPVGSRKVAKISLSSKRTAPQAIENTGYIKPIAFETMWRDMQLLSVMVHLCMQATTWCCSYHHMEIMQGWLRTVILWEMGVVVTVKSTQRGLMSSWSTEHAYTSNTFVCVSPLLCLSYSFCKSLKQSFFKTSAHPAAPCSKGISTLLVSFCCAGISLKMGIYMLKIVHVGVYLLI